MAAGNPITIVVGPLALYLAPVGEAFPESDATPGGNWALVGTSGNKHYSEDGVTVTHEQTLVEIMTAGATGPQKAVRTAERLIIGVTLMDMDIDEYTRAINNATPTTIASGAGVPATKSIALRRGETVAEFALIARGPGLSPLLAGSNFDYRVPRVYVGGQPTLVFNKDSAAGLAMEFIALEDPAASTDAERFGHLFEIDGLAS